MYWRTADKISMAAGRKHRPAAVRGLRVLSIGGVTLADDMTGLLG
jgi:hypothetical protein